MGLLKETMQAIIRIDQNLNYLCKGQDRAKIQDAFKATYQQKPIEQKREPLNHVMTNESFDYHDIETFGGRLKAVRIYEGLKQEELASDIGVTPPHISNLEANKSVPSAMFIRSVSLRYGIDEHWLGTGKFEARGDEDLQNVRTMMGVVSPSERYPIFGREEKARVMTPEDLKKESAGQPLQTLEQMKEQMENLIGFYSQTPQSGDTSASDLQN